MSPRSRMGELELAVLDVLWERPAGPEGVGGASGREVHAQLHGRELAYTTVTTVLDRLARKDVVVREREGRAFRYTPRQTRAEMTAETMRRALDETGPDREQALVAFVRAVGDADAEVLRTALGDHS